MRVLGLALLSVFFASRSSAYLEYAPNDHVMEEIYEEPYRILPHSDHYAFAIDGDFFKPVFSGGDNSDYYRYDFYHGNGYWVSLRSEFKPVDRLTLNLKLNFTQGTSSNGPTFLALIIPMVGVTYEENFLGFDMIARLSDIGRQTIGTGIFIEQKETNGGYFIAKKGEFNAKVMVDGTGSFTLDGGIIATEFSMFSGFVGVSNYLQETATVVQPPAVTYTIFSKHDFKDGFGYGAEAAFNSNAQAALLYLKYENTWWNQLRLFVKPQFRYYGHGILGNLPGNVENNYVSYDQNDKPFTNVSDIFSFGDQVKTYSTQANLEYAFNKFYRVFSENEWVDYLYQSPSKQTYCEIFYRAGVKFFPFHPREDNFALLVGNKYLIASTTTPAGGRTYSQPNFPDLENRPLFVKQLYFMINFETKM